MDLETIYRQKPVAVIIKIKVVAALFRDLLCQIPEKKRDDARIRARHQKEMEERGLAPVRARPDSGFQVVNNLPEVRLTRLVYSLVKELGYVCQECFWQAYPGENRATIWLKFEPGSDSETIEADDEVVDAIERFLFRTPMGFVHVWVNQRPPPAGGEGEMQRVDTINCNAPHDPRHHPRNTLEMDSNFQYVPRPWEE